MKSGANRILLAASLSLAAAASSACHSNSQTQDDEPMQTSQSSTTGSQSADAAGTAPHRGSATGPGQSAASHAEITEEYAANALTSFSLKLAGHAFQRAERGDNVVLSPWSVNSALALVVAGANSETWTQLVSAMGYGNATPDRQQAIVEAIAALNERLQPAETSAVTMTSANRAWLEQTVETDLVDRYRALLADTLHAPVDTADFRDSAPAARERINAWVSEETNGKIPELLPEGSVDSNTNLILTNAVYFLADWDTPFRAELTEDKVFYVEDNAEVQVPTMRQTYSSMTTWSSDVYTAIAVPYKDRNYAMAIYLPAAGKYDAFEQALRDGDTEAVLPQSRESQRVNLQFPKTEIRWSASMKDALRSLGVTSPFTGEADFTRMFQNESVALADVYHEAFMRIDEQGTEAAAATGALVSATSMPTSPPLNFTVDRPYYLMIVHTEQWTPVFMAKVNDPRFGDTAPAEEEPTESDIVR